MPVVRGFASQSLQRSSVSIEDQNGLAGAFLLLSMLHLYDAELETYARALAVRQSEPSWKFWNKNARAEVLRDYVAALMTYAEESAAAGKGSD